MNSVDQGLAKGMAARRSIMVIFFLHALAGGSIFPRIPDLQQALGVSESALGLVLMGQPVGGLVAIVFSSFAIEQLGPRRILLVAIPIIAISTVLIALSPNSVIMFAMMLSYGLSFSIANMAMNVEADRVEAATGSRIMNTCHGVWSFGYLASSGLGVPARGLDISPLVHFSIVLPFVIVGAAYFIWRMQDLPARAHAGGNKKRVFAVPTIATLLLVGIILSETIAGGAVRAWSVIFMRDVFTQPAWQDALSLPFYLTAITIGRMFADGLTEQLGPVVLTRTLLLVAALGLGCVISGAHPYLALIGFALIGLGTCTIYPLVMSAAARIGDRPASENVSAVSIVTVVTMLGSPALIGFIADGLGIRMAFAILAPLYVMAFVLSHHLADKSGKPAD